MIRKEIKVSPQTWLHSYPQFQEENNYQCFDCGRYFSLLYPYELYLNKELVGYGMRSNQCDCDKDVQVEIPKVGL